MGEGRPLRLVVWTAAARRQLGEALDYIGRDSPRAAGRFLLRVSEAASSLDLFAERGRIVSADRGARRREIFVDRWRIRYRAGPGEVSIVAFIHGSRDSSR